MKITKASQKEAKRIKISDIEIGQSFIYNDNLFLCVQDSASTQSKRYVDLTSNSVHNSIDFMTFEIIIVVAEVIYNNL